MKEETRRANKWISDLKLECKGRDEHIMIEKIAGSRFQNRGISDYIICWDGNFIGMEAKVGEEKPTKRQEFFLERVQASKGTAIILRFWPEYWQIYVWKSQYEIRSSSPRQALAWAVINRFSK